MRSSGGDQLSVLSGWLAQLTSVAMTRPSVRACLQDAECRIEDAQAAEVAAPEIVHALGHTQRRWLEALDGVPHRVARLFEEEAVPLRGDGEGRVRPVMIVRGVHHHLHRVAALGREDVAHHASQLLDVRPEHHVHVRRHEDHDPVRAGALHGERAHAQVVAHPVRVVLAVAHGDRPLIELRCEDTGVVRLHVEWQALRRRVAMAAVDGGKHRPARRPDLPAGVGRSRRGDAARAAERRPARRGTSNTARRSHWSIRGRR